MWFLSYGFFPSYYVLTWDLTIKERQHMRFRSAENVSNKHITQKHATMHTRSLVSPIIASDLPTLAQVTFAGQYAPREVRNTSPQLLAGMICGVIAVVMLVSLLWFLRNRRHRQRHLTDVHNE